jgi:hypothetical protein
MRTKAIFPNFNQEEIFAYKNVAGGNTFGLGFDKIDNDYVDDNADAGERNR